MSKLLTHVPPRRWDNKKIAQIDKMPKNYPIDNSVYHVFNKSIAGYKIFNERKEFTRMLNIVKHYQFENPPIKFSKFLRGDEDFSDKIKTLSVNPDNQMLVKIVAYCIMPTHIHLILQQLKDNGISKFTSNILNSYTRYFNLKYKRKGPLWEGRTKRVLVESDEQLLHLTRYIHLNPVTAYLVDSAEKWHSSSYNEYISSGEAKNKICSFKEILDIKPHRYKTFVEDQKSYQRELAKIKHLYFE